MLVRLLLAINILLLFSELCNMSVFSLWLHCVIRHLIQLESCVFSIVWGCRVQDLVECVVNTVLLQEDTILRKPQKVNTSFAVWRHDEVLWAKISPIWFCLKTAISGNTLKTRAPFYQVPAFQHHHQTSHGEMPKIRYRHDFFSRLKYQYEVTLGLYMLTTAEKVVLSSLLFPLADT